MRTEDLLGLLLELADRLEIEVQYVDDPVHELTEYDTFCVVKGHARLYILTHFTAEERATCLIRACSRYNLDDMYVPEAVREALHSLD